MADLGGDIPYTETHTITFSIYIDSFDQSSWGYMGLVGSGENNTVASSFISRLRIQDLASDPTFSLSVEGSSNSTAVTCALDTWYTITIHNNATAASSYFQLVGGGSTTCDLTTDCTFTRYDFGTHHVSIGTLDGEVDGEGIDYEIGYITISTP